MILNVIAKSTDGYHAIYSCTFPNIFIKWCQSYYDNNNNVDDDAVKSSFLMKKQYIKYSKNNCVSIKEINDDHTQKYSLPSYYYKMFMAKANDVPSIK